MLPSALDLSRDSGTTGETPLHIWLHSLPPGYEAAGLEVGSLKMAFMSVYPYMLRAEL